jgi:hypothetical protein
MKKTDLATWLALPALLAPGSCASTSFQQSSFELIVGGNEASYPAFQVAAKECGYSAFRRFAGAAVQNSISVGPHYNLSRVSSRAARCTTGWVDSHPETSLIISGH